MRIRGTRLLARLYESLSAVNAALFAGSSLAHSGLKMVAMLTMMMSFEAPGRRLYIERYTCHSTGPDPVTRASCREKKVVVAEREGHSRPASASIAICQQAQGVHVRMRHAYEECTSRAHDIIASRAQS